MKIITTFFSILALASTSMVGQGFQLSGKTIDGNDIPLPYVNVLLKNSSDSSLVKAAFSDESGSFRFSQIVKGSYFIETSFVGLAPYYSEVIALSADQDLGSYVLSDDSQMIDEVVIKARRPMIEVQASKTIFNIEGTLNATGTNGWDLLRKAPGVIVDNNNNIILEGKAGVQFYINGKQSPLRGDDLVNFLKTLQSTDIDKVEIITQPSAKYDAEGNAGIINILLKKDKTLGTNGTLTLGSGYGKNLQYNSSLSLNHRNKKQNWYATYSNGGGDTWSFINLYRLQEGVTYDARSESINSTATHNGKLGVDFFTSKNSTLGVVINGSSFSGSNAGFTRTPILLSEQEAPSQVLISEALSENNNHNLSSNINYLYDNRKGTSLQIDLDYGQYSRDASNRQPNAYYNGDESQLILSRSSSQLTPTDIDIISLKTDASWNALDGSLEIGAKISRVNTENVFDFFNVLDGKNVFDADRSNTFDYTEQINAAYLNYNRKWKKFSLQAGLRTEQTITKGNLLSTQDLDENNIERKYINLFPSGGLSYNPDYSNAYALSYSRRIARPNYKSLNPFEFQLNELSFVKGNPFLQPQYTDNLKVSHTYKYRFTTSIGYSFVSDFFAQVTDTIGSNRNFLREQNIANQKTWNLGFSAPFDVKSWWSVFMNVNAYRSSYEATAEKYVPITRSSLSLFAQNTFRLPQGLRMEVSGWFSSPTVWGGTYLTNSMGSLDMAIQKRFLNDQLSLRVAVSDLLFTSPWSGDTRYGDLYIDGSGGWESRRIRINLSYAFGRNEIKKSRKRNIGLEAEQDRIN